MNVLRYLIDLLKLRLLPDIDDKEGVREWLRNLLETAKKVSEMTSNKLDDTGVDLLLAAVNSDAAWDKLYSLMHFLFCREHEDVVGLAQSATVDDLLSDVIDSVQSKDEFSVAMAVNPALILQIVLAIIELLRSRNA